MCGRSNHDQFHLTEDGKSGKYYLRFQRGGLLNIRFIASNGATSQENVFYWFIMEPVTSVSFPAAAISLQGGELRMTILVGTNVSLTCTFNKTVFPESNIAITGRLVIFTISEEMAGGYGQTIMSCDLKNAITPTVLNVRTICLIQEEIDGLVLDSPEAYKSSYVALTFTVRAGDPIYVRVEDDAGEVLHNKQPELKLLKPSRRARNTPKFWGRLFPLPKNIKNPLVIQTNVTFYNNISSVSVAHTIRVQHSVKNIRYKKLGSLALPLEGNQFPLLNFSIKTSGLPPTNATYTVTLRKKSPPTTSQKSRRSRRSRRRSSPGTVIETKTGNLTMEAEMLQTLFTYKIREAAGYLFDFKFENLASKLKKSLPFQADVPITGLSVSIENSTLVEVDTERTLTVVTASGSRKQLLVKSDNAIKAVSVMMPPAVYRLPLMFNKPGQYRIRVTVTNSVSKLSRIVERNVTVVRWVLKTPPMPVIASTDNGHVVSMHIVVANGMPIPYNIIVQAGYVTTEQNEITSPSMARCAMPKDQVPCILWRSKHRYTRPGDYRISMTVTDSWKQFKTFEERYNLVGMPEGLTVLIRACPRGQTCQPGKGANKNTFPSDTNISIVAETTYGTHLTYNFDIDGIVTSSNMSELRHVFLNADSSHTIRVNVSNKALPGGLQKVTNITVKKAIAIPVIEMGLSWMMPVRNWTTRIEINLGRAINASCYSLDFGDGSSNFEPTRIVVFGDKTICDSKYLSDGKATYWPKLSDHARLPTPSLVVIEAKYQSLGPKALRLEGMNYISERIVVQNFIVTRGPCWSPSVSLRVQAKTNSSSMEDEEGYQSHFKSKRLVIQPDVFINCTSSSSYNVSYSVFKITNTGEWLKNITERELGVSLMPDDNVPLIIPVRALDYGYHKIVANASMTEEIGMEGYDHVLIKVVHSPLIAGIVGGFKSTAIWGGNRTLSATNATFDPDTDPGDKKNMNFHFMCRRPCETFPEYDSKLRITKAASKSTCSMSTGIGESTKGCFIQLGEMNPLNNPGELRRNYSYL